MRALLFAMSIAVATPAIAATPEARERAAFVKEIVAAGLATEESSCWMPICEPQFSTPAGTPILVNPNWLSDRRAGCACLGEPSRAKIRENNAIVRKLLSQGAQRIRRR